MEKKFPMCMVFPQIKIEYLRPSRISQDIEFPVWKWVKINMDFILGL